MKNEKRRISFSLIMSILAALIFTKVSDGAESESLWYPAFRPSSVLLTSTLQAPVFHASYQGSVENRHASRRTETYRERRDIIGDQITYGYLHGIVLAIPLSIAGRSVHKNGALIGAGFGMALGSAGTVYAIGENHSDFDRENLLELPLFRTLGGGHLGLATFGGALLGVGVFSPITAAIAYHIFKPEAPAAVQVEAGHVRYSLPTISIQASYLSPSQLETDFTVRLMRIRF